MIERVVENWLSKANERSYEIPFCQLLTSEGHKVVHLRRHGPFEEGKDILAIDPDGVPCAYQLKSEKITLKVWERELNQVIRLVELEINHPSIVPELPRKVFLVTNDQIDEEVIVEIDRRNRHWKRKGYPQLTTIVKGELLNRFSTLHTNFWPIQLTSERTLLEFFLNDGDDYLNKSKLAEFIWGLLPIDEEAPNRLECSRALANAAVMTTYALSQYANKENHVALIEGWIIYIVGLTALTEKFSLEKKHWAASLDLALQVIKENFENLYVELQKRTHLSEGNILVDAPFYRGRVTWLIGLLTAFILWKKRQNSEFVIDPWFTDFLSINRQYLQLWGEGAIPQFLALMWFLRTSTNTLEPDQLLHELIKAICVNNMGDSARGLPNPYIDLVSVISEQNGISDNFEPENYRGRSYTLECLIHLYTRRNWRTKMRFLWSDITHIDFAEFRPATAWQYCLWNSPEDGLLIVSQPNQPQSWTALREEAAKVDTSYIPKIFQDRPELLLLFVIVYPHRLTKDVGKFLDDSFSSLP